MPRISAFYGIVIAMYFREHPPPHFHALYAEHEAVIAIATLELIEGSLPPRAMGLVREWAQLHQVELGQCSRDGLHATVCRHRFLSVRSICLASWSTGPRWA